MAVLLGVRVGSAVKVRVGAVVWVAMLVTVNEAVAVGDGGSVVGVSVGTAVVGSTVGVAVGGGGLGGGG